MRHWFRAAKHSERGNFRAANNELLTLFGETDARGSRRWREMFGYQPEPRDHDRGTILIPDPAAVNARATPKSSSRW